MRGKLEETLSQVEREMIVEALKSARGNKARAARDSVASRSCAWCKLALYTTRPQRTLCNGGWLKSPWPNSIFPLDAAT